ncbi:uncharacterized protein V6R79_010079 [Siganus canaliculatus]
MDAPCNMYDAFKDTIWEELGPLDPDWFDTLSAQTSTNEANVSDQEDLCANQEGHFKIPVDRTSVDSQLFSTPKVFRHRQVVSPATEEESFTSEHDKETLLLTANQSPCLFPAPKERIQGVTFRDLLHTPQKSPLSRAKEISESLGAQIHHDLSWTSSLNTPPVASTLILTKPDESPDPESMSTEKNVVIVRRLFPSLSNASRVGFVSPENNKRHAVPTGLASPVAARNPETLCSPQTSLAQSDCVWRQKLPDAIEDGEIRSTVASVLEGADDVLSIFFTNSCSALRKVKSERVKKKLTIPASQHGGSSTDNLATNNTIFSEQSSANHEPSRLPTSPAVKSVDISTTQWSPLSLSELPSCTMDASCHDNSTAVPGKTLSTEQQQADCASDLLTKPRITTPDSGFNKKKRKFVYTVETSKRQARELQSQRMVSSPGIPQPVQDRNMKQNEEAPPELDSSGIRNNEMPKTKSLPPGNPPATVQDLDVSQLSRDFAQEFTQMPDSGSASKAAEETLHNSFSPSACLLAVRRANQKARQANPHHSSHDTSIRRYSSCKKNFVLEGTISDSGFQSAVADGSHLVPPSSVFPTSEDSSQSPQRSGLENGIHSITCFPSANERTMKVVLEESREDKNEAKMCSAAEENLTESFDTESELHMEKKSQVSSSEKETTRTLNGAIHRYQPEKAKVSLPLVHASGFQTASKKHIQISSDSMEKAKRFFAETEEETAFRDQTMKCVQATGDELRIHPVPLKNTDAEQTCSAGKVGNNCLLTASQKADVTELCTLLEEADSQFEFTQFKAAKPTHQEDASPPKTDKELDHDFLNGIDFDDSFNTEAVMQDSMTVSKAKSEQSVTAGASSLSNAVSCRNNVVSAETKSPDRDGHIKTNHSENNNPLIVSVGFKTAGGNNVRVSKKCLSKARALFADFEESEPSMGTDTKTSHECSYEHPVEENREKRISSERRAERSRGEDVAEMDAAKCQSGFQMASGKGISISAKAMEEADAFFRDCDEKEARAGTSEKYKKTSSGSGSLKKSLQHSIMDQGRKVNSSQEPINTFERARLSFSESQSYQHKAARYGGSPAEVRNNGAVWKVKKENSSNDSLQCHDSDRQLRGHEDALGAGHLSSRDVVLPHFSGGFQTASGKGVAVSSAALKKAKTLLSDFEGVDDEVDVKQTHSKIPVPIPVPRTGGFLAASGKSVAFSSEALQKAKALFSDISLTVETPALSEAKEGHKRTDDAETKEKIHCGFSTAGGAEVQVSKKSLLRAKNLFQEFNDGSISAETIQEADVFFEDSGRGCTGFENTNNDNNVNFTAADCGNGNRLSVTKPFLLDTTSESVGCCSGGGFSTASGTKVTVSEDALKKAKALLKENAPWDDSDKQLKQITDSVPQAGGFQTASGKGVPISSAALKKAKTLFSECEGVNDEIGVKPPHTKMPNPVPPNSNGGFLAASGKPVAFSSEALQKAKALFSDISFTAETPTLSHVKNSHKQRSDAENKEMIHSGFSTAGRAKVHVSQKHLMKAQELFKDFADAECRDLNSHSAKSHHALHPAKVKDLNKTSNIPTTSDKNTPAHQSTKSAEGNILIDTLQDRPGMVSGVLDCEKDQTIRDDGLKEASLLHIGTLNLSGCTETQQHLLAQEALDCTKALLEDENQRVSMTFEIVPPQSNPASSSRSVEGQKGAEKRPVEDPDVSVQPPLKRRLLEEFDRTVDRPRASSLQPLKNSPKGVLNDRSAFKYSVSLRANITTPHGSGKNYVEIRSQKATPTQHSAPGVNLHNKSAHPKTFVPPFLKNSKTESRKDTVLKDNMRPPSAFVPPFKKQRAIVLESCSKSQEEDKLHQPGVTPCSSSSSTSLTATHAPPTNKTQNTAGAAAGASHTSCDNLINNHKPPLGCGSETSAAEALSVEDTLSRAQDILKSIPNIELARDMQDMRIRKKKRQTIRPLPGSLFLTKTSGLSRIPLKAAGNGKPPTRHTQKQLYSHGVHPQVCDITSDTAELFRFSLQQFIKQEAFLERGGVQLADGGWLIPRNDGTAGREEFYRSLCDTPGVDPKLISEEWVYNHYRWIVWKQASMERSFPEELGSLCLTPEQVLLQLKYRYDVEVDHSRRPALRRVMEKDDTAAKTLVLCVCGVVSRGHSSRQHSLSGVKTPGADAPVESPAAVVRLTDGWYSIKAQLDEALTAMLHRGRLAVGGKLIIHGAQLVGSQDACSPLEAPESLMLKICANSSRPARWDTKLGFYRDPRPFLLPVSSLYSTGGPVGCVDIVILRSYPIQWMERKPDGSVVFRSIRAEEKEARRYNSQKQKAMESLFAKVQAEFEKQEKDNGKRCRRRTFRREDIAALQDGEELYEAVGEDPAYMEARLSEQQLEALHSYRRSLMEKKQAELQDRYRKALESAEDQVGSCPKRDVSPVWKLCVADSMDQPGRVYQLSLWRPSSDLQSLLKEGRRYKAYNLTTSDGKKQAASTNVQLTGTKKTQFQDLQTSQDWLCTRFQPRVSTHFVELQNPDFQPLCGEVDLTGYVISVIDAQGFSPAFYLADDKLNLVKVRCFSSLAASGLEDVVKPHVLLALSNLQLRGQSISPTPVVYAGDLAVFSTNPKEGYLQESLSQLKNLAQGQENFFLSAEEKLSHLIESDGLSSISSPALPRQTPASMRDRRQDTKPVRSLGSFTPVSRNIPVSNSSTEKDPSTLKRKRALDYLSRIPSPPPLSPLSSLASPCIKKTFIPPRRSGAPSTLKTVQTPAHKPSSSPVVDEWVNDEELAMIDTQALLVGDLM